MQLINPSMNAILQITGGKVIERYPLGDPALDWENWLYCDMFLLKDAVLGRVQLSPTQKRYFTLISLKHASIKLPADLVLIDAETAKLWASFTYYVKVCEGVSPEEFSQSDTDFLLPSHDVIDTVVMAFLNGGHERTPHEVAEDLFGLVETEALAETRFIAAAVVSGMAAYRRLEIPISWKTTHALARNVYEYFVSGKAQPTQRAAEVVQLFPKRKN